MLEAVAEADPAVQPQVEAMAARGVTQLVGMAPTATAPTQRMAVEEGQPPAVERGVHFAVLPQTADLAAWTLGGLGVTPGT